jgi:HEAT repeat protein
MKDVRIYAALRLAELTNFKDERTIPRLLEALREVNSRFGEIAEDSLKKIGIPAVSGLILALQDEDWRVRNSCVMVLSEIKDASAIRGLIQALNDDNDHVTRHAAEALERIATPEALAAVEQWRRDQGGQQA